MDYKYKFFIFFFFLFKNILSINNVFGKYGSVKVKCLEVNSVAFDSSEFNINDEMYFTFSLNAKGLYKTIYYQFMDNVNEEQDKVPYYDTGSSKDPTSSNSIKKNNKVTSEKKYYTINKENEEKFVVLRFNCPTGTLTIENTKNNAGKTANTIIIIAVVCSVVISAVIITIVCIKRKKKRAAKAAMRAQMASGSYYPQPAMSMGMGMGAPMSVGVGMSPGYGTNYMMNNMLPQPGVNAMQPVPYSRMGNDQTQLDPNPSDDIPPATSGKRIKRTKV